MKKHKPLWALVLSGGGARGLVHIGFLKELQRMGFPKPHLVVGTSMGAILGGLYACGMSPDEIERFVIEEFKISDYLDSFVFKIDGPFGKVIQTGQTLANLAGRPGVDPGHRVLELLEKLTAGKSFEETLIPFRCNAVDLLSGKEVVFKSGSVAKAMRASMSVPVFFEPFLYNEMCLVDGGLFSNMPVAIAREEGFERVLAVDVNRFDKMEPHQLRNGPQVIFRSIECALHAQEKTAEADLKINIPVTAEFFSFFKKKGLIEIGKKAFTDNLDDLKNFFDFRNFLASP